MMIIPNIESGIINKTSMSKLYIVPTPIGNLEDITLRSIRILKECELILAEDTRVTKKLLSHLEISKPLLSFHAHNEHKILDKVIDKIGNNNSTVLVSDAGTPSISDPGAILIKECLENNIDVTPIPGASAVSTAMSVSGYSEKFFFYGFFLEKKKEIS